MRNLRLVLPVTLSVLFVLLVVFNHHSEQNVSHLSSVADKACPEVQTVTEKTNARDQQHCKCSDRDLSR